MAENENKKLSELRVVDLRAELEKRGLDRNGVKQVLLERLSKALTEEGLDPDTYIFEISDKKRTSTQGAEEEKSEKFDEKNEEKPTESDKSEEPEKTEVDSKKLNNDIKNDQNYSEESTTKEGVNKEKKEEKESKDTKAVPPQKSDEIDDDNDGHESPIRLTLEDDDETLHDIESETTADRPSEKENGDKNNDKKSVTSEATSQPESKSSEQSTEKAALGDSKEGEKEPGDGSPSGGRSGDNKLQKKVGAKSNPNVVWISNVAQNTRASELKAALSSCGKVTGAKVVVNARFPGSCCFGYVTMSSVEDVENVIAKLNNTELNGQIIKIDKFDHVRAEQMKQMKAAAVGRPQKDDHNKHPRPSKSNSPGGNSLKKSDDKPTSSKTDDAAASDADKQKEVTNGDEKKDGASEAKSKDHKEGDVRHSKDRSRAGSRNGVRHGRVSDSGRRSNSARTSRDRARRSRSKDRERHNRSGSRGRHEKNVLTFDKIREERERQRMREKERLLREEIRRRHEEAARQREVERRQRSEAHRLEREKEKLRMEREKIEREKAELVRMERERQRLEREKLALEKMELERTLIRLDEERRAAKRPAPYRREESFDERKRSAPDRHFDEPPPPPRFDPPASSIKPREPSPKKFAVPTKDSYSKPRIPYDPKREAPYPEKRGRDYEMTRPSPINRPSSGPSGSSGKYEGRPYDGRDSRGEPRGRELPPTRPKDSRYMERERDRDRSPHFRPSVREERDRRAIPDNKPEMPISSRDHRYGDPNESGPGRFDRNSSSWPNPPQKPFNSGGAPKPWAKDPWRPDSSVSDRAVKPSGGPRLASIVTKWPSGSQGSSSLRPFSGNSNSNLRPVCPPPPGINNYPNRFDYKSLNKNLRKY